jgi:L-alanine-DL-glutamate epimerase-like enolase superfamily enzyme
VELCEQPIARGDLPALAAIRARSPIPIYADEDVDTATDVAALAGVVDGVNLKLRKTGGIRGMVQAIHTARAHGMGVMIGCDLESGIATSAAAQVGALADFVDIDGPTLLLEDPFPIVGYETGKLVLPQGPGLGLEAMPW